ncbi:MAG: methyltransferase domain-containing protein [Actinomycetota bacterium]|jgi:predicted TPR repeat methyltransferase
MAFPRAPVNLRDREVFSGYVGDRSAIVPKDDFLVELARGRRVLDLGCIDHNAEEALGRGDDWLHARLRRVADRLVGVDVLAADAALLNARGFDIRVADVESLDLGEQFDLIIAGDLIEHLSNIGRFLDSVSHHMHDRSAFVVTTPNPFNVEQFSQALFRRQIMVNSQHTVWIDPRVMHELIARSPFEIVDFRWVDTRFTFKLQGGRIVRRIVNPLSQLVIQRRPLLRRDYAVVLMLKPSRH